MTASAIYRGRVGHERFTPRHHRLDYRVFSLYLDLDELPLLDAGLRLFGYNRRAFYSVHDRDHGDGSPLRDYVRDQLARAGLADVDGPVRLLCYPRILGYVFNPLSVYYCHDRAGTLRALIYEVSNTFGERHSYLIPATGDADVVRHGCDKEFYVSPFLPMDCHYDFEVRRPGERLAIAIRERCGGERVLDAWFGGRRLALSDGNLWSMAWHMPLMTLKVMGGIHWEALRLWAKGVPLHRRPAAPAEAVSLITPDRTG